MNLGCILGGYFDGRGVRELILKILDKGIDFNYF